MTVEQYFEEMALENPAYKQFMKGSRLKYPFLPTVDVGSRNKPILFPMELISVRPGQPFSRCTPDMTAKIVRHAAILPQERFQNLLDNGERSQSVLTELRGCSQAACFGVTKFEVSPMSVSARLLPPPKLQYRDQVFEPGLNGEWNILTGKRAQFVDLPANPRRDGSYMYGILIVSQGGQQPREWERPTKDFKSALEDDAASAGLKLFLGGPPMFSSGT